MSGGSYKIKVNTIVQEVLKKKWFISRSQSYHGSGSDAISVGDRPNLNIYKSFFQSIEQRLMNNITDN